VRVLALGGTGAFGSQAVRALAADDRVERISIACRDVSRGEVLRRSVGGKCDVLRVDLEDGAGLREAAAGCDVVLNAAGPAYEHAERAVAAAIDAGRPYVDLCDDAAAAEQVFRLDQRAAQAGVTVVLGLGCSPGVTNLVASSGRARLDEVEGIHVVHGGTTESSLGGVANIMHMLDLIDGEIPVVRNGKLTLVPGFSELEPYDFGPPLGVLRTGLIAHPEPVMFHRSFPSLRSATVRLGLAPEIANDLLAAATAFGLTSERPIRFGEEDVVRREFLARHLHEYLEARAAASGAPATVPFAVQVVVEGVREGNPERLVYRTFEDVAPLIGTALALGAIWLGTGRLQSPGVRTPEQCVDADAFLTELSSRGIRAPQLAA
jgi:saccharopine dehydrogenase-like NADP-dependent oxidoreductase